MRRGLAGGLLASAALVSVCDDSGAVRPQWLVSVGTDASIPGFGDRIRVDLLDGDGSLCASCSRVFDASTPASLPLSFGVAASGDGSARFVRARLFRAENTTAKGDPEDPLIDVLGELPAITEGVVEVNMVLGMSCFGQPAELGSLSSCDPLTAGRAAPLMLEPGDPADLPTPGSWGGGDAPCIGDPPPGMVCVPGGVFLLGSRKFVPYGPDFDPVPEQLVRLPPFYLDVAELDVASARGLVERGAPPPQTSADDPRCAYREATGENDDFSVNCLDRTTAEELCSLQGKRLPSEAEWEFAAVDRTRDAAYPWAPAGDVTTVAICEHAIVARGDTNILEASRQCILETGVVAGPVAGGSPLDVTPLGIRDLAGNLSEWVADDFSLYSEDTCWGETIEVHGAEPCQSDPAWGVLRGGSWVGLTYNAHGFFRRKAPVDLELSYVGVRCALDAENKQ